jgi:hypothetical protein
MTRVLLGLICRTFQIQSSADEADKQGPRSLLPHGSGRNRAFEEGLVPGAATHRASGEEVDFLRRDEAPAKPDDLVNFITNTFMSNINKKHPTAK